mmetsp:Transcript_920/g.2617  ORF Transcript_920/g.2617 Transcript_920/m.2617 type:complete len:311 (-) Transcript_920:72-1004(-)
MPQLRLQHGLRVVNGLGEFGRVRSQQRQRTRWGLGDQLDVHDVAWSQSQRAHHPPRQEDVVGRRPKIQYPADDFVQRGCRHVLRDVRHPLRDSHSDAAALFGVHALDGEQPRHFRAIECDGTPEQHRQRHLVARLHVIVREMSHRRIEAIIQRHADQPPSREGLRLCLRVGYPLSIVVLHLLFQSGNLRCFIPVSHHALHEEVHRFRRSHGGNRGWCASYAQYAQRHHGHGRRRRPHLHLRSSWAAIRRGCRCWYRRHAISSSKHLYFVESWTALFFPNDGSMRSNSNGSRRRGNGITVEYSGDSVKRGA